MTKEYSEKERTFWWHLLAYWHFKRQMRASYSSAKLNSHILPFPDSCYPNFGQIYLVFIPSLYLLLFFHSTLLPIKKNLSLQLHISCYRNIISRFVIHHCNHEHKPMSVISEREEFNEVKKHKLLINIVWEHSFFPSTLHRPFFPSSVSFSLSVSPSIRGCFTGAQHAPQLSS